MMPVDEGSIPADKVKEAVDHLLWLGHNATKRSVQHASPPEYFESKPRDETFPTRSFEVLRSEWFELEVDKVGRVWPCDTILAQRKDCITSLADKFSKWTDLHIYYAFQGVREFDRRARSRKEGYYGLGPIGDSSDSHAVGNILNLILYAETNSTYSIKRLSLDEYSGLPDNLHLDLSGLTIRGVDFREADLEEVVFCNCEFVDCYFRHPINSIRDVAFHEDGIHFVVAEKCQGFRVMRTDAPGSIHYGGNETVRAVAWTRLKDNHGKSDYVLTGGDDRCVRMWKAEYSTSGSSAITSLKEVGSFGSATDSQSPPHTAKIRDIAILPKTNSPRSQDTLILSLDEDGTIAIWAQRDRHTPYSVHSLFLPDILPDHNNNHSYSYHVMQTQVVMGVRVIFIGGSDGLLVGVNADNLLQVAKGGSNGRDPELILFNAESIEPDTKHLRKKGGAIAESIWSLSSLELVSEDEKSQLLLAIGCSQHVGRRRNTESNDGYPAEVLVILFDLSSNYESNPLRSDLEAQSIALPGSARSDLYAVKLTSPEWCDNGSFFLLTGDNSGNCSFSRIAIDNVNGPTGGERFVVRLHRQLTNVNNDLVARPHEEQRVRACDATVQGDHLVVITGGFDQNLVTWKINVKPEEVAESKALSISWFARRGFSNWVNAVDILDEKPLTIVSGHQDGTVRIWRQDTNGSSAWSDSWEEITDAPLVVGTNQVLDVIAIRNDLIAACGEGGDLKLFAKKPGKDEGWTTCTNNEIEPAWLWQLASENFDDLEGDNMSLLAGCSESGDMYLWEITRAGTGCKLNEKIVRRRSHTKARSIATHKLSESLIIVTGGLDGKIVASRVKLDDPDQIDASVLSEENASLPLQDWWITAVSAITKDSSSSIILYSGDPNDKGDVVIVPAIRKEVVENGKVKLSLRKDGKEWLTGHSRRVTELAIAHKGAYVYSASEDGMVYRWKIEKCKGREWRPHNDFAQTPFQHPEGVTAIKVQSGENGNSDSDNCLVTACRDGKVRVWDLTVIDGWFNDVLSIGKRSRTNNRSYESQHSLSDASEASIEGAAMFVSAFGPSTPFDGCRIKGAQWRYTDESGNIVTSIAEYDPEADLEALRANVVSNRPTSRIS